MDYADKRIVKCSAMPWNLDLSCCRACNGPLSGRQTRWCSQRCSMEYGRNHVWSVARDARLKLDNYTCQRCGICPGPKLDYYGFAVRYGYRETAIGHEEARRLWSGPPLEVNHVWPLAHLDPVEAKWSRTGVRKVKHADTGCHHHLSLLMTLCRPCHRRVTNQQFGLKQPSSQLTLGVAS